MPATALNLGPLGWRGKVPARGDFVRGGAAGPFIDGVAAWVEAAIRIAKESGAFDTDAFLEARFLRLASADGVFGVRGGLALIGPSMDSGGRPFPLLLAMDRGEAEIGAEAIFADGFAQLEDLFLKALDPSNGLEALSAGQTFSVAAETGMQDAAIWREGLPASRPVCNADPGNLIRVFDGLDPSSERNA